MAIESAFIRLHFTYEPMLSSYLYPCMQLLAVVWS